MTVDHLSKYLAMRLTLDLDTELPEAYRLLNFCIYVAPTPGQFVPLAGAQTLRQINDKYWKVLFFILKLISESTSLLICKRVCVQ